MTVTAAEARIEYAGNGTTTVFAYPYQFFQSDDLDVWVFTDATGVGVEQILGVDYTVTGALNPSGGSVTLGVAPPGGTTLIIINNPDIVQTTHYVNADDFPADSHEQALDRLTKIAQRLSDRLDRTVHAPDYAPEDQVPDAQTLVDLVDDAQNAADNSEASASQASASAGAAAVSANTASVGAATASAAASSASTSATSASASATNAANSATAANVDKIIWRGNWAAATAYLTHDAVYFSGTSYIAKANNTNSQPDINPANWDVLAQQGASGPAGSGAGDMLRSANLSDVLSPSTSRANLGLGNSATAAVGTTAGTVAAGDDARIVAVATKAPLASPVFTGNPQAPTPSPGDNDTSIATTAFVQDAVAAVPVVAWFTTGDAKLTFKTAADTGWVMMNDGTMGDASSGGTARANADTQALFALLWNIPNTYCPVLPGGRGANAAADFAAHKTIKLPLALGRALAISGNGAGLSSRALGQFIGEENHTLTATEQASMGVGISSMGVSISGTCTVDVATFDGNYYRVDNPGSFAGGLAGGDALTNKLGLAGHMTGTISGSGSTGAGSGTASGGGQTHNNMQPTSFFNVMVKL